MIVRINFNLIIVQINIEKITLAESQLNWNSPPEDSNKREIFSYFQYILKD